MKKNIKQIFFTLLLSLVFVVTLGTNAFARGFHTSHSFGGSHTSSESFDEGSSYSTEHMSRSNSRFKTSDKYSSPSSNYDSGSSSNSRFKSSNKYNNEGPKKEESSNGSNGYKTPLNPIPPQNNSGNSHGIRNFMAGAATGSFFSNLFGHRSYNNYGYNGGYHRGISIFGIIWFIIKLLIIIWIIRFIWRRVRKR